MFRYLALSWNAGNALQASAARFLIDRIHSSPVNWRSDMSHEGLTVFHAGVRAGSSEVHLLEDGAGIVLGTLFSRPDAATAEVTSGKGLRIDAHTASIIATKGRKLLEIGWGRYVAFLRDGATGNKWALRDPGGFLPCFWTNFRGVDIFFSCLDDCIRLEALRFSINWDYVGAHVVRSPLVSRETALKEVTEVQAGECIAMEGDIAAARLYWNPLHLSEFDPIEDPVIAAAVLRNTAKACVHAWASCFDGVLCRLSGGLDSSIVLGCLRDAPKRPEIACLNYFCRDENDDERLFARLAAQHAHCRLIERERNTELRLEEMLHVSRSVRPYFYLGAIEMTRAEARLAAEVGALAIFGGGGGDELFCRSGAALGAVDYMHRHGVNWNLLSVSLDTAFHQRVSMCTVLKRLMMAKLSKPRQGVWKNSRNGKQFVSLDVAEAVDNSDRFLQPCLQSAHDIPPGKLWHIYSLLFPPLFQDPLGLDEDPDRVDPLLSQPLLEACIRMPTYVLNAGKRDRPIARRAFASDVPQQILWRRDKAATNGHISEVLKRNIDFARQWLLDGALVRAGMLNGKALEQALTDPSSWPNPGVAPELVEHLSTEVWLKLWADEAVR